MFAVGEMVTTKKQHPCGSKNFKVLDIGVFIKLQCDKCSHIIIVPYEKAMKMLEVKKK